MEIVEKLKNDKKLLLIVIGLVVLTFIVPYITIPGLVLWWFYKTSKWSKRIKIGLITCFVGGIIVTGVLLGSQYPNTSKQASTKVETGCIGPDGKRIGLSPKECEEFNNAWRNGQQTQKLPIPTATSKPSLTPTPTPIPSPTFKPIEKFNIVVTSQIVKEVDNKCRYFFDIRNKDIKPFEGSVTISLFTNEQKNPLIGDTFITRKPIEPELGTSQYIDANTCPPNIHGAYGITKFKYTVKKGNDIVNSGEGEITDKFEDVDAYNF